MWCGLPLFRGMALSNYHSKKLVLKICTAKVLSTDAMTAVILHQAQY